MNRNDNSSSTPSSSSAPLDALEAPTFSASVAPVAFPRFPTVEEILEHQAGKALHPLLQLGEAPPSRPQSMFEGMLGSRLDVLLDDVARQPDAYDAAARGLLEELAAGTKKLADLGKEDRHALDRATVDFASYKPPPKKASAPAPLRPPTPKRPALMQQLQDGRAPQVEAPGGPLTAYWWLS